MTSSKLRKAGIETRMTEMAPFRAKARPDTAEAHHTSIRERHSERGARYGPHSMSAAYSPDLNRD